MKMHLPFFVSLILLLFIQLSCSNTIENDRNGKIESFENANFENFSISITNTDSYLLIETIRPFRESNTPILLNNFIFFVIDDKAERHQCKVINLNGGLALIEMGWATYSLGKFVAAYNGDSEKASIEKVEINYLGKKIICNRIK